MKSKDVRQIKNGRHWYLTLIAFGPIMLMANPLFGQTNLGYYTPSSPSFPTPVTLVSTCPVLNGSGEQIGLYTDCPLVISVAPLSNTGGHLHEGPPGVPTTHPASTLVLGLANCTSAGSSQISGYTDSSGYLTFTLCPTLVGQVESISTYESGVGTTVADYQIGYSDLVYAYYPKWLLIGATDSVSGRVNTGHGGNADNHWMTPATRVDLENATTMWLAYYPKFCAICVNDAGLPFGGKFDIAAINSNESSDGLYHPWTAPHKAHDRGSAVDIAAQAGACPYPVDQNKFLAFCKASNFNSVSSIPEGSHVHCNSLAPGTNYPY